MAYTKRDKTTAESEIFFLKPDKRFKIWFYIVGEVHRQDYKQRKRGENWFSYDKIIHATGASKKQVFGCLDWLRDRDMIRTQKETRGMTVTVLNYAKYQDIVRVKGNRKETERKQKGNTEGYTIEEEDKKKEYIIVDGETTSDIDKKIKDQIKEIIDLETISSNRDKFSTLVELIALGLQTGKTEKAILSRIADLEKKLEVNGVYSLDVVGQKIYDRKKAWNVAQTCRTRNEAQNKPCGNPLNSFNKFLSTNK